MAERLSVAIVAMNEGHNLSKTLESVAWADEIVVIDSGSTDDTISIAKSFGATVHHERWRGYGAQVNAALDRCEGPWILNLDADEVLSPESAKEIRDLLQSPPRFDGFWIPRLNFIFGRYMRHGGLYPDYKLRLFRKGSARLEEDTEPHATPKTKRPTGRLKGNLLHNQYPNLALYIDHMQSYSSSSVPLLMRRGKSSRSLIAFIGNVFFNPIFTFIWNYFFRLGFLDGREGLLFHLNHSLYVNWKYAKAWAAINKPDSVGGGDAESVTPSVHERGPVG